VTPGRAAPRTGRAGGRAADIEHGACDDSWDAASRGHGGGRTGAGGRERGASVEHASPGVLIVDDESVYRDAIARILRDEVPRVERVETGGAALEAAADTAIGVVLLDVGLPDLDGIAVLERLRALRPALRVVMLSDVDGQDRVLEALRLGACDYLAKPLHDEELVLAVRRAAEGFTVSSRLTRLRGRLDRLVARLEEIAAEASGAPGGEARLQVADAVVRAASEMLEAEKTSIMLVGTDDAELLRVTACVGQDRKPEDLDAVAVGEGVAGSVCAQGETLHVTDVAADARIGGSDADGRYATGSFVVVPVRAGGRALGVLCATDRIAGGAFSEDDATLLRLLATHAGALLRAAETAAVASGPLATVETVEIAEADEDDVTRVAFETAHAPDVLPKDEDETALDPDAELARLVCQAAVDEIEPERVIRGALRPIGTGLPAAPVSLFLVDPADGALRKEGEYDGGVAADRAHIEPGRGLTGSVLQTGHVVATDRPSADPRFDAVVDTPESGEPRPFLCVPVKLRGKVVGVLRAFLPEHAEPSARSAEVLGAAMSAAVRNALLYRSLVEAIEEVAEARRAARG